MGAQEAARISTAAARCRGFLLTSLLAVLLSTWTNGGRAAAAEFGPLNTWDRSVSISERIYGTALLDTGIVNEGNLLHVKRLLDKLESGKPLTVTAFGSSLVHDYAGCFQSSWEALWDYGVVPNPHLYPTLGVDFDPKKFAFSHGKCMGGFVYTLMRTINATWPNPRHIFFNNGKGGACLHDIANGGCFTAYTPEEVDIVILDTVTNTGPVAGGELFARHFLRQKSNPLVFYLSNARNCFGRDFFMCVDCMRAIMQEQSDVNITAACEKEPLKMDLAPHEVDTWERDYVAPWQTLSKHYDVAHLDINPIIKSLMNGPVVAEDPPMEPKYPPGNDTIGRFKFITDFYIDSVHFRKERLGVLLLADLITHFLKRSQDKLKAMSDEAKAALTYTMPKEVIHEGVAGLHHLRCYGTSLKNVLEATKHKNGSDDEGIIRTINHIEPGDNFQGFSAGRVADNMQSRAESHSALPPLNIVNMEGFAFQSHYKNKNNDVKIKPGWLADKPASTITFEVDTAWPGIPTLGNPEIMITYVKSYAGWGQARVSCTSGCTCDPRIIDAHWEEKVSLNHMESIRVSQSAACQMTIVVLQDSASGGHKWKLVSILVRLQEKAVRKKFV